VSANDGEVKTAFRLRATYFWYSPKVGKNEFKGEDFDFFPLENPLIETTKRGPAGPLLGFPPGSARIGVLQLFCWYAAIRR